MRSLPPGKCSAVVIQVALLTQRGTAKNEADWRNLFADGFYSGSAHARRLAQNPGQTYALVGEGSALDANVEMENAVALPGAYLGRNIRLTDAIVQGGIMVDIRRACPNRHQREFDPRHRSQTSRASFNRWKGRRPWALGFSRSVREILARPTLEARLVFFPGPISKAATPLPPPTNGFMPLASCYNPMPR